MSVGSQNKRVSRMVLLSCVALLCFKSVCTEAQAPTDNSSEIQALRSELRKIEARLDELETAQKPSANPATAQPPVGEGIGHEGMRGMEPAGAPVGQEPMGKDSMDRGAAITVDIPHVPEMKIRGFGDVRAYLANQNLAVITNSPASPTPASQGGNSTFALGIMDLFITSQISRKFSYLTEMGFEADPASNGIGVDLERAQVTYLANRNLSITMGRSHAMLGY